MKRLLLYLSLTALLCSCSDELQKENDNSTHKLSVETGF